MPVPIAVTKPVEPIVATEVLLLLHVPPDVPFVSVVVRPVHNEETPDIADSALTVIDFVT